MDLAELGIQFIQQYGLIAIFILLVLDAALLLPVFPGELVLILAVTTYVHDIPSLLFIIAFTTGASLVGSLILYGIMRGGGRKLVERFPSFFAMPRKRREKLELSFQRASGQSLVLFLRFIPLTRIIVSIPAGLAKMPLWRFVLLTTIGMTGFHAAFLWFAYEVRQPGSELGTQADQLQAAYASPAWDYVQTNTVLTGFIVLLVGAVISYRASVAMIRDPEESTGSLIGTLATWIMLWGGLALGALLYLSRETVYWLLGLGGLNVDTAAESLNMDALSMLVAVAIFMVVVGFVLHILRDKGRRRRRLAMREKRIRDRKRQQLEKAIAQRAWAEQRKEQLRPKPQPEPVSYEARPPPRDMTGNVERRLPRAREFDEPDRHD